MLFTACRVVDIVHEEVRKAREVIDVLPGLFSESNEFVVNLPPTLRSLSTLVHAVARRDPPSRSTRKLLRYFLEYQESMGG